MAKEMYMKVNRMVRQIAEKPQDTLPLSMKALKLLREIPLNGNGAELASAAKGIREAVRELYSDQMQMIEAAQLAEKYGMFIRSREPMVESIH